MVHSYNEYRRPAASSRFLSYQLWCRTCAKVAQDVASGAHKKAIGEDIKTVQFGWPLGMPLVEKLEPYLWEVRSKMPDGIARVLFTVDGNTMILLNGFVKKTRKIPQKEINLARSRLKQYQDGES